MDGAENSRLTGPLSIAASAIRFGKNARRNFRSFGSVVGTAQAKLPFTKRRLPLRSAEIATQQNMAVTMPKL